jgi:hypothetical protein
VPKGKVLVEMYISVPTDRAYYDERTERDVAELENVVLSPDQANGIEIDVTGNDTVNFDLRRAKR